MNYHNPAPASVLSGIPFDAFEESDRLQKDIHYMKQYYPREIRLLAEITELVADRYDTPHSFFYDEFPDRISTLHILKEIKDAYQAETALAAASASEDTAGNGQFSGDAVPAATLDGQTLSTIAELLLLQEILLRRMRRRNRRKLFFPPFR